VTKPQSIQDKIDSDPEYAAEVAQNDVKGLLSSYSPYERKQLVRAAKESVELLTEMFPELTAKQQGQVAAALSMVVAQLRQVPAYSISKVLDHTSSAYALSASSLYAGVDLDAIDVGGDETTPDIPAVESEDEFRPGNYL
jgi:hypothetical protein